MNGESNRYDDKMESMLEGGSSEQLEARNVPLEYLRNITNNFSDERRLGEGGFGTVYKGVLQNGQTIAVKKLNSSIPGVNDRHFENEANHLMRLKHPNVVLLVGWCSVTENIYVEYKGKYICAEKSERLLCLEYMSKGNLRDYLSDEFSGLDWDTRFKIIEGICYGLRYLHEEWQLNVPIVHMDLKPANILLDNNMAPKIADFGLSRLFNEEKTWTCTINRDGTLGYMSPEYINRGLVSTKSDIFSLGVIIIEIVTGRRDYPDDTGTPSEDFIEMVLHNWSQRKGVEKLFGASLEIDYHQIRRCIQIGLHCVNIDRYKRPTISKIIKALHSPESAYSSNIKGVHGPQSGKRERNCGETSWMEKEHTSHVSIYETFTMALQQWQKKTTLRRIRVIFNAVVFVVLLRKRGGGFISSNSPQTALIKFPSATTKESTRNSKNGFSWRKDGQEEILGSKFPRSYYWSPYHTTQAEKQMQRSDTDTCVFDVAYKGDHTGHQKQHATVVAAVHGGNQSPPPQPPAPLEQQQDQSMQIRDDNGDPMPDFSQGITLSEDRDEDYVLPVGFSWYEIRPCQM